MGRYVFNPEISRLLEEQEIGFGSDIQLKDAIQKLNETQHVFACNCEGE